MGRSARRLTRLYLGGVSMLVVTVIGCVGYMQWEHVRLRWHARRFAANDDASGASLAYLRRHAIRSMPYLAGYLAADEPGACQRIEAFWLELLQKHTNPTEPADSHVTLSLAARLHHDFDRFSAHGRRSAAAIAHAVLRTHLQQWSPNVPMALDTAGEVVCRCLADSDPQLQEAAIGRLPEVWDWDGADNVTRPITSNWKRRCYTLAAESLNHDRDSLRAQAAAALVGAPFHEADLALIDLLDDNCPDVKRAVLQALGHAADGFSSEQKSKLVAFLHDEDADVRRAAAALLRLAGLSEAEVRLAFLLRHPVPAERARVASLAGAVIDDPALWLLELANDNSPTVRLAVARSASNSRDPRLRDRVRSMALNDSDPNVRAMARAWMQLRLEKSESVTR